VNATLGVFLYHFSDPGTLHVTTLMALISSIVAMYINRKNFVYIYRVLIIVWVGLVPALAISQGGYFAIRMPYVQTLEVGWIFGILVCTTLFSSQVGFRMAHKVKFSSKTYRLDFSDSPKTLFWMLFGLLIIAGYLYAKQKGDFVFESAYGAEKTGEDMPVHNLQSVAAGLFGMAFIVLARIKGFSEKIKFSMIMEDKYYFASFLVLVYVILWAQFLRGARMDPVGLLIVLYIMYYSTKGKIATLNIRYFVIAVTLVVLLQIWGEARSSLAYGISLFEVVNILMERDVREVEGVAVMFFQGTFNNISVGVAGVIHAIQNGLYEPLMGKSYLDFISRIPPESIYPDRPESLAWFSVWVYDDSSGGGMNEMGEIYLNFGIYGSLFVPGIISYIIGWAYKRHLTNPLNIWHSLPFIGLIAVYTRGLLYQTFDSFKAWITVLVLYFAISIAYKIMKQATNKSTRFNRLIRA
jgi:hypothetical protein